MDGYCKKGEIEEAWDLFLEVSCKGLKHDTHTYNIMIHGLFSKGRFVYGWKFFNDMKACWDMGPNRLPVFGRSDSVGAILIKTIGESCGPFYNSRVLAKRRAPRSYKWYQSCWSRVRIPYKTDLFGATKGGSAGEQWS
ncbi:hypothetical protein ACS0TY_025716 [Phlomoides rotata]